MGKKKKRRNRRNVNRPIPNEEVMEEQEKKEEKFGTKEFLVFLFWGSEEFHLIEPLSFCVLLKRILLVLDNLLATGFVILSFMLLTYYGELKDWQGAVVAAENYISGHPVFLSLLYVVLLPFFWRPISHTKLMPFSHYVNDLVVAMFVLIYLLFLIFILMSLKSRGSFISDEYPYWVTSLSCTIFIFSIVYRPLFLMSVFEKNTIKSFFKSNNKGNHENEGEGCDVEAQSEHSTLWDDFKFFVFGWGKKCAPAESITYKLTLRRLFIILDNLIAPAVCYYFSVWMRRFYYGVDCSFSAVVDDIFFDKDYGNILILYLVMLFLFWRPLWYSDKKPCWTNFKEPIPYALILLSSAFIIFFVWRNYVNLIDAGRMQEYTYYNRERGIYHFEHYVPLWMDIIRVIGVVTICCVRRLFLLRFDDEPFKDEDHSDSK
ncbi:MAG: hypothetical protein J6Y37_02995 [Paludibacteraceae bacterium]|nr:hypothetical protein [Paludibacteraceae bacterium]